MKRVTIKSLQGEIARLESDLRDARELYRRVQVERDEARRSAEKAQRDFDTYRNAPSRLGIAVHAFRDDLESGKTVEAAFARTLAGLLAEVGSERDPHGIPYQRRSYQR